MQDGQVPMATLNTMESRTLTQMFRFGHAPSVALTWNGKSSAVALP
jgi:hypothetical protein